MPGPVGSSRPPFSTGRRAPERRGVRAKDLAAERLAKSTATCCSSSRRQQQEEARNMTRPRPLETVEQALALRVLLLEELLQRERDHWQQEMNKLRQQLVSSKKLAFDPLRTNSLDACKQAKPSGQSDSDRCNKIDDYAGRSDGLPWGPREIAGGPQNVLGEADWREEGGVRCLCVPLGIPSYGAFDYYNWADKHSLRCQKRQFEMASRAATEAVCMYKRPDPQVIAKWRAEDDQKRLSKLAEDEQNRLSKFTTDAGDLTSEYKFGGLQCDQEMSAARERPPEEVERSPREVADTRPKSPYRWETGGKIVKESGRPKFEEERAEGKSRQRKEGAEAEGQLLEAFEMPFLRHRASPAASENLSSEYTEQAIEFTSSQRRRKEKAQRARAVAEARGKVKKWRAEVERRSVAGSNLSPWNKINEDKFRAEDMPKSRSRLLHEQNIIRMKLNAEKRRKKRQAEEIAEFWRRFVKYC